MEPTIQIALDFTNLGDALAAARIAVRAGADWLQVSPTLMLAEGLRGIQALRKEFPHVPLVADWQTMDHAGVVAEMMFQAGGNMVVVMGQAHDASILEQVKMAKQSNGKVMCDVMLCPNKPARARQAEEMGVDYIRVHTGVDERNLVKGASPLANLKPVLDAVTIPVLVGGELGVEQATQALELGAQMIVLRAPLASADPHLESVLRETIGRLKKTKIGKHN